ncbi:SDR family NAD(P)-dependent oxidoreductase [Merismopedia glauca]|uniref:Short-chain dehydrogenase n=1 Tax=Merismopedia glauca CCAP 1448/3 TaxID=1296344 RepID=A0A2T1BY76_9CYAN|nr:SDR family oxidoreductase [Merismopedia glauca]PSB00823.1 hypothetical protein C7B64_21505 [Merismopedia glauca CCAP 1448/3]
MRELSGTTAIITGASRGMGVEIAKSLAERKVRIVLAARSAEALEAVRHDITQEDAQILTIPTDITDLNAQAYLVEQTLSKFGTIDLLINNAGVVMPSPYEHTSLRDIEQTIAVNLTGAMTLTQRVLSVMLAHNRGHIVNVASLSGLCGVGGGESYSASKHGLVGFTRSLRLSLKLRKSRVSASVICPGFVKEVGMYTDRLSSGGNRAPFTLGTSSVYAVSRAIIRAIEHDLPEVVVSPRPIRLLLGLMALSPRLGECILKQAGAHQVFEVDQPE